MCDLRERAVVAFRKREKERISQVSKEFEERFKVVPLDVRATDENEYLIKSGSIDITLSYDAAWNRCYRLVTAICNRCGSLGLNDRTIWDLADLGREIEANPDLETGLCENCKEE